MPAIDTLDVTFKTTMTWSAQNAITGTDYAPITNPGNVSVSERWLDTTSVTAAGGADQLVSYIVTIAGGGNTTLDVSALTNILGASATMARLKGWQFRLLSTEDDATNGTNCSGVTIGNAAANQQSLNMATNNVFTLYNGDFQMYGGPRTAGFTVDASNRNIFINNDDANNSAAIQITLVGGAS